MDIVISSLTCSNEIFIYKTSDSEAAHNVQITAVTKLPSRDKKGALQRSVLLAECNI